MIRLCHVTNSQRHLQDSYDPKFPDNPDITTKMSKSSKAIEIAMIMVSLLPIFIIMCLCFATRSCVNCQDDDNEVVNLRTTAISNLSRQTKENIVFRRAVLEKFFSDVTKVRIIILEKEIICGSYIVLYLSIMKSDNSYDMLMRYLVKCMFCF